MFSIFVIVTLLVAVVDGEDIADKDPYHKAITLFNQTDFKEEFRIISSDFSSFTSKYNQYNSQGADDFIIPAGQTWCIKEVIVLGNYDYQPLKYPVAGPAEALNVSFFRDDSGLPGDVIQTFRISGDDFATKRFGSISIKLPAPGIFLQTSKYWMSVQASINFTLAGEWSWTTGKSSNNSPAVWRNPGGGFSSTCPDWAQISDCLVLTQSNFPDFMFSLEGYSQTTKPSFAPTSIPTPKPAYCKIKRTKFL